MARVTRFDTPASLRDMPIRSPFYENWHNFIADALGAQMADRGGGEFYDPSEVNVAALAERNLVWMGFPRALMVVSHRDDRRAAFIAGENRNVQEEYCEWRVTRNDEGKITKVVFVTETPEYWEALWAVDHEPVVNLYKRLVSPDVRAAHLESDGSYNRHNRWNTTKGIVHFIQSINTLGQALELAQSSVKSGNSIFNPDPTIVPAEDNYEAVPGVPTSVDPRVMKDIAVLARKGLAITLREPIGLYIAGWNDDGWTTPDGSPVGDYWHIVRGVPGQVLRLEYEVPRDAGFVVGDIRIGGRPIEWGGQIAEHITCTIGGVAGRRTR